MSQGLLVLPPELILQIANLLLKVEHWWQAINQRKALYDWSRTCTSLYKILSPDLFRCITLHNNESSGHVVQYLCGTDRIAQVKALHFKVKAPEERDEICHNVEGGFPTKVNDILGTLSQFPSLKILVIDFDFFLDDSTGHRWYNSQEDWPRCKTLGGQ